MTRKFLSQLLGVLVVAASSVCSAADIPSAAELEALGLELRWNSQAVLNVRRDVVAHASNDENNIYIQSSAGVLTVFDAENGRKLWSAQVGRSDEPAMKATSNKDIVLLVVGPVAYGFNKFTGTPVFKHRMPKQPSAGPVMNDSAFFVPITGGAIYAYSIGVLSYKYRYGALPDTSPRSFMWRFICGEEIIRPPVLGKLAIAFATEAGNLHSVATRGLSRGGTEFQMMLHRPASAPLSIADNDTSSSVFMLTGDNQAFSVDLIKGSTEWAYPVGHPMTRAPIVVGDDVYIVTTEGTVTQITRDEASVNWGRPVEFPLYEPPVLIGAGMEEVDIDAQVQRDLELSAAKGIAVREVVADSAAARAGLKTGDVIVRIDDLTVTSVNDAGNSFAELPLRLQRPLEVLRKDQLVSLKIQIPSKKWDVTGIQSLAAVGRFSIFGVDQTHRLVAIDKASASIKSRVKITGFDVYLQNHVTDQVYLVASNGELACLREIGPTLSMPELSTVTREARVVSVRAKAGDSTEADGTVLCELELPDGSTQEITTNLKGSVRRVYVKAGQTIKVGDPLVLVADDKFATYYRSPEQRPIDIELMDPETTPSTDESP